MPEYNYNILKYNNYIPYGKLELLSAPTETLVSLSEAKEHLRVDHSNDDTYITTLINVATDVVEEFTRRKLATQTWNIYFDEFPPYIDLQLGIVRQIVEVKYYDQSNVLQTLPTSDYDIDLIAKPGRIYEATGKSFPQTYERANAVKVTFEVGNSAEVPSAFKAAILIIIGRYYENRQDVFVGTQVNELPSLVENLLTPYRLLEL